MTDITPPEPKLVDPPGRERALVWTALASLALHAGLLVVILWSPLRDAMEAAPPQAIAVELVPPPEAESSEQEASEAPPTDAPDTPPTPAAEPSEAGAASASPSTPVADEPSGAPPPGDQDLPQTPLVEPAETAAAPGSQPAPAATEASTSPPVEAQAAQAPSEPAPIPLPRPAGRTSEPGTEGTAGPSGAPVAALEADTGEAEGDIPGALSAEPDVAALELGEVRNAERFYLEAMLREPSLARAREMLETLPREKRLSQTCNIEALAQIGNSGEGFAPDVVMTDAYAMSEMDGTRLSAAGAIFRSKDRWYGFGFDCRLSEDLTQVTGFSYRLGADVTEAVLARLAGN